MKLLEWPPIWRLAGAAIAGVAGFCGAALAGDSAQLNVIGFSNDGTVFAFEEYGVQDGSGFPYSNYYFLDTVTDKFLPGTPIKVVIEEELSAATIRGKARALAEPLIRKFQLDDNPGFIVAYNPVSEIESDPHRIRYAGFPISPPTSRTYTLEMTEKAFPASRDCLNMVGTYSGFTLALSENGGQPSSRVIHEDRQVPASRHCPNGYRIGAIVVGDGGSAPMVAMIAVASFGFEGNDERWIAIPFQPGEQP